ncbi:MAG: peptidoglycan DL-endopeptidase CwlO [Miltoncostaeaceae bacterium]|jgi:cell wall-associated NlpC family hydrolase|nr:peptidoglycan DL-endopeptidase CwlO [Miltoncostaeaceae bacterium]
MVCATAIGVPSAGGEPAQIEQRRAQVAALQAELDGINTRVADAAEAYNGARYRLSQIQGRIESNVRLTKVTQRNLKRSRAALAVRLKRLYATPDPSLAQIFLESDSLSGAMESMELLDQVSRQDSGVVDRIATAATLLKRARTQLVTDREQTQAEVAERKAQQAKVQSLLAERQRVLNSAKGELGRLLEAEEARQAAETNRQNQIALARQASTPGVPTPTPGGPPVALPSGSGNAAAAQVAMQYLGTPYVWGGAAPGGFDCSGLASYAYAQIGKSVPHYTVAIYNQFPKVPSDQLQVGDLVFFRGLGHMGIYIGGGQFVHAPQTGDVVKVSTMSSRSDYVGAVRP